MTNPKTSPVAESVVKVYAIARSVPHSVRYITAGTRYEVTRESNGAFWTRDNNGHTLIGRWESCPHLFKGNWTRIEDDSPTDAGEGVEPVAVIGMNWQLLWADQQTLTGIVNRTGIKIGSLLYAHPTPTDTGLVGELVEALRNASGFLDTPVMRRKHDGDWLYEPMIISIRAALSKAKDTSHG